MTEAGRNNLRAAIVGCGKVADDHAEALAFQPGAELVACCDLTYLMAEQLATRFGVDGVYDDLAAMLAAEQPDVVHITTPPQSHLPLATLAMEAGSHVWVEKPLAVDRAEVEKLVAVARATGRKLTVGHSYWFDTPAEDLREIVGSGRIGEVVHVDSWYGYSLSGDYGKAILASPDNWVHDLPGKLFQNNIDHLLNKVMEFLPSPDLRVMADGFRSSTVDYGDRRDDMLDELRLYLTDPSGVTSFAAFSSAASPKAHWVRVHGTEGTVTADFNVRTVELAPEISLPTNLGRLLPSFGRIGAVSAQAARNARRFAASEFHYFAGFRTLLERFYHCIETGGPEPIALDEMVRMARLQDDIWAQLADRGPSGGRSPRASIEGPAA